MRSHQRGSTAQKGSLYLIACARFASLHVEAPEEMPEGHRYRGYRGLELSSDSTSASGDHFHGPCLSFGHTVLRTLRRRTASQHHSSSSHSLDTSQASFPCSTRTHWNPQQIST